MIRIIDTFHKIGKAFRNEIVARQFIFRMREFEQMEMHGDFVYQRRYNFNDPFYLVQNSFKSPCFFPFACSLPKDVYPL